jgi:beta-glucosidase
MLNLQKEISEMNNDIKVIVDQMTLEEKAEICSGMDFWHIKGVERLGIPSVMMTDGPHGLRKQVNQSGATVTVPSTCFPSGAALACSWDQILMEKVGMALGEECLAESVSILLGPAANIKRSPLCGRNFEYFSEDPYLSSKMAAAHIKGVQSQGVGTALKHYAANNQEHRRWSVDTVVDERTLREIYLTSFEGAVKEAGPWTVMCAYNKVNGDYCSENKYLLTDILKEEWGHEGFIMSDWGAVNNRVDGLAAGLELEMPSSNGVGYQKIVAAVKTGKLPQSILDKAVERILAVVLKAVDNKKENAVYDKKAHHQLAREVARECMVLLKNEENILPLKKEGTIAVIGTFAKSPRYQGGGSSHINPTKLDDIYAEIEKAAGGDAKILYAAGYKTDSDEVDDGLIAAAKEVAGKADVAVILAGLPERYESEGYDRQHMRIPENHRRLIETVARAQDKVIVVLSNGSPIEMPWLSKVKGVLESYLGGQALGGAIADLLFGAANPCGKLAETFPQELRDNPAYLNFPGDGDRVEYREGLFVGYRYYDAKNVEPLFPFGYGLSYSDFEYTAISVDKKAISDQEPVKVTVKVKNTGKLPGKEIVQLYIKDPISKVTRPEKELKGFAKIELQPGEEKAVTFDLNKRSFAYYNVEIKDWYVESGDFEILIGRSSREIVLKERVNVQSSVTIRKKFHRNTTIGDLISEPFAAETIKEWLPILTAEDGILGGQKDNLELAMTMMEFIPLRALVGLGKGIFTEEMIDKLLQKLNSN